MSCSITAVNESSLTPQQHGVAKGTVDGKRTVKEQLTGLRMGSYTLQESESIADAI